MVNKGSIVRDEEGSTVVAAAADSIDSIMGGPSSSSTKASVLSRSAAAVRRKRSGSSQSGGGSSRRRGASSGSSLGDDQQQQPQEIASGPSTPAFLTPEPAARISKKNLSGTAANNPSTGGTTRTADMTPSPLPSLPDVSPVPSAVPLTAPTPGPVRGQQRRQQQLQTSGSDGGDFFGDGGGHASGHLPEYEDEDDGGRSNNTSAGGPGGVGAVSPLHAHRRSRVLFQENDDDELDTSDENFNHHHQNSSSHHDDRDDGGAFGYTNSTGGGGGGHGRRTRSLPTIDFERTHPSLDSINSTGQQQQQQQPYHNQYPGMPQDAGGGGYGGRNSASSPHFSVGRSSPSHGSSSHRRRSSSRQSSHHSSSQQQHFTSPPSNATVPAGSSGARQRGSQSRHYDRRLRGHSQGYIQQQQGQYNPYGGGYDQNESKTSMVSIDDTHPLTSSSSAERSSSSNESSPERGYGQLMSHPGQHLGGLALTPSAAHSVPFENVHHQHDQQLTSSCPVEQDYIVSSPSKDKYTKHQPYNFGGGGSAPAPLVQPNLGVLSPWDRGQTTQLGPATPSIMSSRPLSPEASSMCPPNSSAVGISSPRYGSSFSSYSSTYSKLHRIRIRFRALLSSGLMLASVMFMLILAANYGSIATLDFGSSAGVREAVPVQSQSQQTFDYKPVPVGSTTLGGGVGLGVHEGATEEGATFHDLNKARERAWNTLYKENGEDSSNTNIVIRRGAGGLRVARNDAPTDRPPKQPEKQGDDKTETLPTKDKVATKDTKVAAAAAAISASVAGETNKKRKRGFPKLDSEFYASKNRHPIQHGGYPRLLNINHKVTGEPPPSRQTELYPAEFSDNTQFYPVIDSEDDERADKMEMRHPYEDEECEPMADWQTTYNPSCNGMHELDVENGYNEKEGRDLQLFGTKGFWRNAWKMDLPGHDLTEEQPTDTFVLKTLKYEHNFEDNFEEHDRIDAIAMERLTSSPHVINIYGFCGHSVITEYADGPRLGTLADKSKKIPLKRLEIARDIASGLADVHGIDGDDQPSFVHLDINPANVVVVGKTLKLNDFNIGIILKKNKKTGETCGFPAQYPNPQWRSPEESREQDDLTEKVDIFSMGHIFFRLICGHEPWNKLEPGGRPEKDEVLEKVKKGTLPFIPDGIINTKDREIQVIRDAMIKCYTADPDKRPSARTIATDLDKALKKLSSEAEAEKAAALAAKAKAKAKTKTTTAKAKTTTTTKDVKKKVSSEATTKATATKRKVKETDEKTRAGYLKEKETTKKRLPPRIRP